MIAGIIALIGLALWIDAYLSVKEMRQNTAGIVELLTADVEQPKPSPVPRSLEVPHNP